MYEKVNPAHPDKIADRIAGGTAQPGTVYTADADAEGHIILTESDVAACV